VRSSKKRPRSIPRRRAMRRVLVTPEGRSLYRQRQITVEPVFGQLKFTRAIKRFQRRGRAACRSEWRLIAATHNLLKLHDHRSPPRRPERHPPGTTGRPRHPPDQLAPMTSHGATHFPTASTSRSSAGFGVERSRRLALARRRSGCGYRGVEPAVPTELACGTRWSSRSRLGRRWSVRRRTPGGRADVPWPWRRACPAWFATGSGQTQTRDHRQHVEHCTCARR
jgi:hypothetical protein